MIICLSDNPFLLDVIFFCPSSVFGTNALWNRTPFELSEAFKVLHPKPKEVQLLYVHNLHSSQYRTSILHGPRPIEVCNFLHCANLYFPQCILNPYHKILLHHTSRSISCMTLYTTYAPSIISPQDPVALYDLNPLPVLPNQRLSRPLITSERS